MPAQWYRDDPSVYSWQRGDPISWLLFARNSLVRVFVSGSTPVRAQVAMRLSRLQVSNAMTVSVKGFAPVTVSLPGPAAKESQYDTVDTLDGPTPVPVRFEIGLRPGWNNVTFTFQTENGEHFDLGSDVISAAVAPDLSFTTPNLASNGAPAVTDRAFTVYSVAPPPNALAGDPEIVGTVATPDNRGASVAVALAQGDQTIYRNFPIARDGTFDIAFMHAFPNDWEDASLRIAGIWLIARSPRTKFTGLFYNLHALPGENLRKPGSLETLPFLIDGHPAGSAPVFLTRGKHLFASADRQVKIGLLTLAPAALPRTRDFGVVWQRRSPTSVDVTARKTASPFLLVFGEAYHPEWRATLDGTVLTHVVVNGVSNGWIVPALPDGGQISLTFGGQTYFVMAGAISVIALIVMIVLAWNPDLWPVGPQNR